MISQGASEINMSFMIDEDDADEAVRSLHAAFFKDPDPAIFDVEARDTVYLLREDVQKSSFFQPSRSRFILCDSCNLFIHSYLSVWQPPCS
jgi:hypothetical protein